MFFLNTYKTVSSLVVFIIVFMFSVLVMTVYNGCNEVQPDGFYSITGTIKDTGGVPMNNIIVIIPLDNTGYVAETTDKNGYYAFPTLLPNGFYNYQGLDYTIIPLQRGYSFNPSSKTFKGLNSNEILNFTGTKITPDYYNISGILRNIDNIPISGITLRLHDGFTSAEREITTDNDGSYVFSDVNAIGYYSITPLNPKYSFDPPYRIVVPLTSNQTDVDFKVTQVSPVGNIAELPTKVLYEKTAAWFNK